MNNVSVGSSWRLEYMSRQQGERSDLEQELRNIRAAHASSAAETRKVRLFSENIQPMFWFLVVFTGAGSARISPLSSLDLLCSSKRSFRERGRPTERRSMEWGRRCWSWLLSCGSVTSPSWLWAAPRPASSSSSEARWSEPSLKWVKHHHLDNNPKQT